MIFDSHCHPQFPQYDEDREEMIKRALDGGVFMIAVGTDLETSKQAVELAQRHNEIWATIGIHPNDINQNYGVMIHHNFDNFVDLLKKPKVVAIGEVGLDYYRTTEPEKQKRQKEVFKHFIDLAQKTKKPMVLHFRDMPKGSTGKVHEDALAMLPRDIRGVSHSFTGTLDNAKEYVNRGMYVGFNGIVTFARQYDEVVKYVPLENILLETDAPFLTPIPYRGKRNEPLYVKEVAKKIAELKNVSIEKVVEQTTKNCKNLFNLTI
jgi:TatD DNase family protein